MGSLKDIEFLKKDIHELKLSQRERDAIQDEQIKTLFHSVKTLRNVVYTFALIMLLALIYGALGPDGFNAVRKATPLAAPVGNAITGIIPAHNDLDRWLQRHAA